jgi:hypothetical protein
MKCISLWQPWAQLIALGQKRFETRGWPTRHRGAILIHAAKVRKNEAKEMLHFDVFWRALNTPSAKWIYAEQIWNSLPFGAIVCTADLVECWEIRCDKLYARGVMAPLPEGPEKEFGNYDTGRYAWELANVRMFAKPVPYVGHQGLFDVPLYDLPPATLTYAAVPAPARIAPSIPQDERDSFHFA